MFLHAGNNVNIKKRDIVGIFDIDNSTISKVTRNFLNKAEKNNEAETLCTEIPKSFILTDNKNRVRIYISQISTATLLERMNTEGERKSGKRN